MNGVLILTESLKDNDPGNVRSALHYLTTFSKGDFSQGAKDSLITRIKLKTSDFDQLIKLAGFLNLSQIKDEIKPYAQAGNPKQIRWAALLALARMGDAPAMKDLMQRVSKLPVNDDVVYKLFPDLIYTRQREALAYMIEALNSDSKNCRSADAENEVDILCGYRIMEQLAPIIQDFPFKLEDSGDLQTDDYPAALLTVRKWFSTSKDFTILSDQF
jgi:HEAT repeat protein